jgi:hypothetical protein
MRIIFFHHRVELYLLVGRENGTDTRAKLHNSFIMFSVFGLELGPHVVPDRVHLLLLIRGQLQTLSH